MPYIRHSTNNPLGKRPWRFATSNNGLSLYTASDFVIPGQTPGGSPENLPSFNWGAAAPSVHPAARRHCARKRARGMGKYIASNFVLPAALTYSGPPPWQRGLGDYTVDPATMPAPPAGMQYDAGFNLIPIPPPSPLVPIALVGAAGFAAWYFLIRKQKMPRVSLPVA